jgi:hypothetical protein
MYSKKTKVKEDNQDKTTARQTRTQAINRSL